MIKKKVRTRFAPSPTGELHIGGARTALFNYLYAKKYKGAFILRFEDTDLDRNIKSSVNSQYQALCWLNIIPDESIFKPNPKYGSYFQSQRKEIYLKYAEKLIKSGYAYYSSQEDEDKIRLKDEKFLKAKNPSTTKGKGQGVVIRIKVKKDIILSWNDGVFKKMKINSNELKDFVLIKSDKTPSYNFANVIDDHLFEITHVIRGQEHISNTPKQLLLYHYFNWEPPIYSHVSLIIDYKTNKKLSKRDHDVIQFISQYQEQNYLPIAVNNFMLFLGWYDNRSEVLTFREMIDKFTISNLNKAPSSFDLSKLLWFNHQHLKTMDDQDFLIYATKWLKKHNFPVDKIVEKGLIYFKPQLQKIDHFLNKGDIFFPCLDFDESSNEFLKIHSSEKKEMNELVFLLKERIFNFNEKNQDYKDLVQDLIKSININKQLFFKTIRLATTKRLIGSPIVDLWKILGKDILIKRIDEFLKKF